MSIQAFVDHLQLAGIPGNQASRLGEIGNLKSLKVGDKFIREGETPRHFAFVVRGLFRYFYLDDNGKEFTKGFFAENSFLSSYSAMTEQRGSYFTIEALEDSDVVVIDNKKWNELRDEHPAWNRFLVTVLEKAFAKKEERERQLLLFDAEKRYEIFLEQFPGLSERVNQRMIASYLGITPVALSRTRKKMGVLT